MPVRDMPTMAAALLQNSSYGTGELMGGAGAGFISNSQRAQLASQNAAAADTLADLMNQHRIKAVVPELYTNPTGESEMPSRRIVQVYIADPSDAVPLKDAILYTGEQKMTDLTDQELFFEIDIKAILEAHNAKRTKLVDKKIKDRTEYLEPAKVRDLRMVVVTVASF